MTNRAHLFLAMLLLAPPSMACSILPPYEALPTQPPQPLSPTTPAPEVAVDSITRGHAGDGGTCADLGFLVFKVPDEAAAFKLEIVEGNLPIRFPQGFVRPRAAGTLGFVWGDGNTDEQEPLRAVVKIIALSKTGEVSEPALVQIADPGSGRGD